MTGFAKYRYFVCSSQFHKPACDNSECLYDGGDCESSICGDGKLSVVEQCDDGNHKSGDGCSSICTVSCFFCRIVTPSD